MTTHVLSLVQLNCLLALHGAGVPIELNPCDAELFVPIVHSFKAGSRKFQIQMMTNISLYEKFMKSIHITNRIV